MSPNRSAIRRPSDAVGSARDALGRRARTLADAYRLQGVKGALVLVTALVPDSVLSVEWFALLQTAPLPDDGTGPQLEFRWGVEDDLPQLSTMRPTDDLEARLRRGDRVHIALDDGRLVGYLWFRAGAWTEHAITFALRPDEMWAYDGLVPPEHRGRRIYPAISLAASRALAREGIVRYLLGVDHLNGRSMSSSAKGGARPLESVLVIGVLGLGLLRRAPVSGGRPRWTRFRRASGVTVVLPPLRGIAERE